MAYDIFMKKGLQAAYDKIGEKDASTLYFCTDSGNLYLGATALSGKISFTKPQTGVVGTLYVTGGCAYAWNGTGYVQVSKPAVTAVPDSGANDNNFPTTKAVVDFVTKKLADLNGGDLTTIKNDIKTLKADVEAAETDITNLKTKDTEIEGNVTANTGEINKLKTGKADKGTTLGAYGITDAYTKTAADQMVTQKINTALGSVLSYKGTVENYAALPAEDQKIGDVYNVKTADPSHQIVAGDNVAWDGTKWDVLAGTVDLSAYAKTSAMTSAINAAKTEVTNAYKAADTALKTEVQQYADGKASTAKTEAVAAAKSYTDTAKTEAVNTAKGYTDTAKTSAISTAKSYTDTALTWGTF